MTNCNAVTTPGIAHSTPTIEDEALLDHEQHKRYRRIVGKLQWLAYTRPDIAYSTKELARDPSPTELSQKRVKHLLRYLHGTKHYKFTIEPTTTLKTQTPTTSWISTFMSMPTGQDALLPGNQLQVSTSSF